MTAAAGPGQGESLDPRRPRVWVLDTTEPRFDLLADAGLVSKEERDRAEILSVALVARQQIARRTAVRLVLGRYHSCDPAELQIVTAPGGKPVLLPAEPLGSTVAFSTGHSGDLFCIAVGTATSLGLDLELLRRVTRTQAIADRWFGDAEGAFLRECSEDDADAEFMRLWTAKEALAKRHGAGLRLMRGREGELDIEAAAARRMLHFFSPQVGYAAALASSDVIDDVDVVRTGEDVWIT